MNRTEVNEAIEAHTRHDIHTRLLLATRKGYGVTTQELAADTGLSLWKIRKILRENKREWGIYWYADWWHGKNAGYTRRYKLNERYR